MELFRAPAILRQTSQLAQVLYEPSLAWGRNSAAVKGKLPPESVANAAVKVLWPMKIGIGRPFLSRAPLCMRFEGAQRSGKGRENLTRSRQI